MANDAAKDQLDSILSIIGFGIVSDFRELREAMFGLTAEMQQANQLIDQVNRNTSSTEKTIDDFQKELSRQRDARAFKQLENQLERRNKLNSDRSEASLRQIAQAMEKIQRELRFGGGDRSEDDGGLLDDAAGVIVGGGSGSFLKGAAKVAGKTAVGALAVGGLAVAGATGAYSMGAFDQEDSAAPEAGGQTVPTAAAASVMSTPPITSDLSRAGAGTGAALQQTTAMAQSLKLVPDTARQKAIAKVAPKVPSWLSKFGGRLTQTIGLQSIPVFGRMVGGYFAFNKFMSGDSWYALGAEYVSGKVPQIDVSAGPDEWTASVISTLAIQTYLIARDIYQEENTIDIRNGIVPNFDDLEASEKIQVLKAVKVYVEAYINNLISRSKQATDAVTGITPSVTSGAAAGSNITGTGGTGSSLAGAAAAAASVGGGSAPPAAESVVGPAPNVGQDTNQQMQQTPAPSPGGGLTPSAPSAPASEGASAAAGTNNEDQDREPNASPSDTMASISTGSDQTSMYGTGMEPPISEIIEAGRGYNIVRLADGSVVKKTGDRNWRNNNPGNMEYGKRAKSYGAIGSDGRFAIFPTMQMGDVARERLLFESGVYEGMSIEQAILKYAPPEENPDVGAYINTVAKAAGVSPGTQFGSLDQTQRASALEAMKRVEGFKPGKVIQLEPPKPMAEGGKVTPLTSDKPKAGRDMSMELRPPPTTREEDSLDEDKITSSQNTIDARRRDEPGGSPKEKMKNTISSYMPAMSYLFGTMTEELSAHLNGEVSADKAFKDAMNPLS